MQVITISRQVGSLGDEIAIALSKKLGYELFDRNRILSGFLNDIAGKSEMAVLKESARAYLTSASDGLSYIAHLKKELTAYASEHPAIFAGCGTQIIFRNSKDAVHIRIIASADVRAERLKKRYHISMTEAEEVMARSDKKQKKFISTVFERDVDDPALYHMVLNTSYLSVFDCVQLISALLNERVLESGRASQPGEPAAVANPPSFPTLKNPSELEFAKILDMYRIQWKYEPKTFPIEWDAEGNVSLAFSPDFYLTAFDTYIELTTMNQKYISKKNKKLKKLRELYPGINVRIVNRKDFNTLLERFRPAKGVG